MSDADHVWPPSPFWDFSLDFYSGPGAKEACLALQDEHGLDVNLVLLAAWLASGGRRIGQALALELRTVGDRHQTSIMRPLRAARRALDPEAAEPWLAQGVARQRRSLLAVELELERLEQLQLERLVGQKTAEAVTGDALFLDNLSVLYPELTATSSDVQHLAGLVEAPRAGSV